MKRFRAFAFHAAAAISLLLCMAAGVAWYRSHPNLIKSISYTATSQPHLTSNMFAVTVWQGTLKAWWMHRDFRNPKYCEDYLRNTSFRMEGLQFSGMDYSFQPHTPPTMLDRAGIAYYHDFYPDMFRDFQQRAIGVSAPLWFMMTLLLVLPLIETRMTFKLVRRRRRLARGLCLQCGYDLRATPSRCPECGFDANGLDHAEQLQPQK